MSKAPLLSIRGQIGPYGKHHPHLGTVVFTGRKNHGHLVITGEVKATDAIKNELARRKPAIDDVVPRLASGARPFVMGHTLVLPKFGGNRRLATIPLFGPGGPTAAGHAAARWLAANDDDINNYMDAMPGGDIYHGDGGDDGGGGGGGGRRLLAIEDGPAPAAAPPAPAPVRHRIKGKAGVAGVATPLDDDSYRPDREHEFETMDDLIDHLDAVEAVHPGSVAPMLQEALEQAQAYGVFYMHGQALDVGKVRGLLGHFAAAPAPAPAAPAPAAPAPPAAAPAAAWDAAMAVWSGGSSSLAAPAAPPRPRPGPMAMPRHREYQY